MSRTKKTIFLLLGILLPLILGLAVLEAIFGNWFNQEKWLPTAQLNIIRSQYIEYKVDNVYAHQEQVVSYSRDRFGLRGGCRDPQNIDIITMGGSTTDQRLISDGQTWQDILQSEVSRKLNKPICISNAGVDGHTTFGHIVTMDQWFPLIPAFKPKLYLLYIGINDAGIRLVSQKGFDTYNVNDESIPKKTLLNNSAFYQLVLMIENIFNSSSVKPIAAYAGHEKRPPEDLDYKVVIKSEGIDQMIERNTQLFSQRLLAIVARANSSGGKVVCVTQPHLFTTTHNGQVIGTENVFFAEGRAFNGLDYDASIKSLNLEMKNLCTSSGGYYIDIASKNFSREDFYDAVHNTPQGAHRLGEYLFDEFQRLDILSNL